MFLTDHLGKGNKVMTTVNQSRQEIETSIIERANQDQTFRQDLIRDPKGTVAQFLGTVLPEGMKFTVIEEEMGHHYLVLPPAPPLLDALPLDDLELALVGGGRTLRPIYADCSNKRVKQASSREVASSC